MATLLNKKSPSHPTWHRTLGCLILICISTGGNNESDGCDGSTRRAIRPNVPGLSTDPELQHCIQCGNCSGICPWGYAMEFPPSRMIAALRAGIYTMSPHPKVSGCALRVQPVTSACPAHPDHRKSHDAHQRGTHPGWKGSRRSCKRMEYSHRYGILREISA